MRRVVVTGIGIYSCIGCCKQDVIESLQEGLCGLIWDYDRIGHGLSSGLTGAVVKPFNYSKFMAEETMYMAAAVAEAILDSNLVNYSDFGIIIGNDGNAKALRDSLETFQKCKRTFSLGSSHVLKDLNSNPSLCLSVGHKNTGISLTVSGACASGGHAVGLAYRLIQSGMEDVILCGGCQEINEDSIFAFDGLRVFSKNRNPKEAVRPFDKNRDGLAPSGGAACLILEDFDHAIRRNAPIYAEILGYGASSSGDYTVNSIDSEIKCMKDALRGIDLEAVDIISAHGTATTVGDFNEANAILQLFSDSCPIITATKALTGHELWMAGASEIIYSILSIKNGFIPPNPNLDECPFEGLNIHKNRVELEKGRSYYMLSNSFGLGGNNSSILIKVFV